MDGDKVAPVPSLTSGTILIPDLQPGHGSFDQGTGSVHPANVDSRPILDEAILPEMNVMGVFEQPKTTDH